MVVAAAALQTAHDVDMLAGYSAVLCMASVTHGLPGTHHVNSVHPTIVGDLQVRQAQKLFEAASLRLSHSHAGRLQGLSQMGVTLGSSLEISSARCDSTKTGQSA